MPACNCASCTPPRACTCEEDIVRCDNCDICESCQCNCVECANCNDRLLQINRCRDCECCSECCRCNYCNECERHIDNCHCSSEEENNGYIHGYSYRPPAIFYPSRTVRNNVKRYYGIELEVNGNRELAEPVTDRLNGGLHEHAYCKDDGSIVSGGFEIVTHPHSFKEMRALWTGYFDTSKGRGPVRGLSGYKSGECGMHVHITRAALSEPQIRRMVAFLNAPENLRFVTMIGQRTGGGYHMYIPNKGKPVRYYHSDDRYEALNLANSHTVEVRIFRSSYRLDRILKNLEFCDALCEFTATAGLQDLTVRSFYSWLEKRNKTYRNLWAYLIERGFKVNRPDKFTPVPSVAPAIEVEATAVPVTVTTVAPTQSTESLF